MDILIKKSGLKVIYSKVPSSEVSTLLVLILASSIDLYVIADLRTNVITIRKPMFFIPCRDKSSIDLYVMQTYGLM